MTHSQSQEIEEVINQCVRYGTIFPGIINKKGIIEALKCPSQKDNFALNWLNKEWDKLKLQIRKESKPLLVSSEEIVITDCSLGKVRNSFVSDSKENEVMKAWINTILLSKAYNGKINLFKKELSDAITIKAKEVYGELWDNSSSKHMLNQVRRYVQGQESSFEWNNYLISSVAAVMAKGDDWSKLLDFMHSKGMSDYRLAFAFYGELNGFANLTRDFTDNLFELEDKQYVADVYTELYGQLFGESPLFLNQDNNIKLDTFVSVNSMREQIIAVLPQIKAKCKGKFTEELENNLMIALDEYNGSQTPLDFINYLASSSSKWNRRLKVWKELNMIFSPSGKKEPGKYGRQISLDFSLEERMFQKTKLFFNDSNVWNIIKDLVPDIAKNDLKKDLEWFQKEMQKPSEKRYKYYQQIDANNNKDTIERFCRLKEKDKNGKPQAPYFTKDLRERVKQYLLSYYADR